MENSEQFANPYNPQPLDDMRVELMTAQGPEPKREYYTLPVVETVEKSWLEKVTTGYHFDFLVFGWQMILVGVVGVVIVAIIGLIVLNSLDDMVQQVRGTPAVDARQDVLRSH